MELNYCSDNPSCLDYIWEILLSGDTNEFPWEIVTIFNQMINKDTKSACTRYGIYHISNGQNINEQGKDFKQINPRNIWLEYLKTNPTAENTGATLQSALKQAKERGDIAGYYVCKTIEDCKNAIDSGCYIYTGSQYGDWGKLIREKVYHERTDGKTGGHAFNLVDYDGQGFYECGSLGEGRALIPYKYFDRLFTKYAILDFKNKQMVDETKVIEDNKSIEIAKEYGLTNGKDLDQNVTREQIAIMFGRLVRILKDKGVL